MARKHTKSFYPSPLRGAIVAIAQSPNVADDFMSGIPSGVIGANGVLPWSHNREDLKRFKKLTMKYVVIMGRKTWDSIRQKELPGRRNIVISRNAVNGVEHYNSVNAAITACGDEDFWIIGGGQIYAAAMKHLNFLDITYVQEKVTNKTTVKFPYVDARQWREVYTTKTPLKSTNQKLQHIAYRRIDAV